MHNMIGMGTGYECVTHVNVMFGSIVFAHLQMYMFDCLLQWLHVKAYALFWCTPSYPKGKVSF